MASAGETKRYAVADLEFAPKRQSLSRAGQEISLSPRLVRLLKLLVERAPETVTHDEIADHVWGKRQVVSPENIAQHVAMLRKALGDEAASPRYVSAVRGEGYRLVAEVRLLTDGSSLRSSRTRLTMVASVLLLAAVIVGAIAQRWTSGPPAIVVLPFESLSQERDDRYFVDGLSEELITRLSQVEGLLVFGRTTSFALRGVDESQHELVGSTGATHVLEGSVRREGDHIRIGAQLVSTDNGLQVWSGSWDRDVGAMLTVQREIAAEIASNLGLKLSGRSLADDYYGFVGTDDPVANEHYLIALGLLREGGLANVVRAEELLRMAIDRDPGFIASLGILARALGTRRFYEPERADVLFDEWNQIVDAIKVAAPDHPAVEVGQGLQFANAGDWVRYEQSLVDALDSLPPGPLRNETESLLISMRQTTGQYSTTLGMLRDAVRRDPLSVDHSFDLQLLHYALGDVESAEAEYRRSRDLPGARTVIEYMALMRAIIEDFDKAEIDRRLEQLIQESPKYPDLTVNLVAALDNRSRALQILYDAVKSDSRDWPIAMAWWADYLGDSQLAIQLHRDYFDRVRRAGPTLWLPFLADMRQTQAFIELAHDYGLANYWRETRNLGDFCQLDPSNDIVCQ